MRYVLLRYNLVIDKAKFIEQVPLGWDGNKYTWLVPSFPLLNLRKKPFLAVHPKYIICIVQPFIS